VAIRCKYGSYYVYWNEKGKRKEKYFGSGPVGKFKAEQHNKRMGFGKQNRRDPNAVLFGQFLSGYLRHVLAGTKNLVNYNNIEWKFTGTIILFFGKYDIYSLIHADLDDYIIHRKGQKTNKGTPPKQVTINREIDEIQSYLNWCVDNRKILHNPLMGYKRPKDDREVIAPPSVNEINLIIEYGAPHIQRFVIISYYVGARPGPIEIGALKWHDVLWDEKKMMVQSADKGGLNSRRVPIREGMIPLLKHWQLEDKNQKIKDKKFKVENIIHFRGKAVQSIRKGFTRAKERAGIIRRIRPYDIRHAHVTHQLDEGADLKAVSVNVGHKSPDTTLKVYQHVSGRLQKEAIAKLPDLKTPEIAEMIKRKVD
jgi:integrase